MRKVIQAFFVPDIQHGCQYTEPRIGALTDDGKIFTIELDGEGEWREFPPIPQDQEGVTNA